MNFWKIIKIATFNYFGLGFIFDWLMPKPPKGNEASTLQDPPTSKVGDPIQVFFGPFRVRNVNSVGVGDKSVQAIKQKGGKKG